MASVFADLRYSLRQIAKTPVASAIAVLSIALGIGANTAIFSIMNALILRTLPVRNPQQLVSLHTLLPTEPKRAGIRDPVPWGAFEELRKQNTVFSEMFAWGDGPLRNVEAEGVLYPGSVIEVSGEYFTALGVRPLLGRLLTAQDAVPGAPAKVAVLDYRCWKDHFQSDPAVVGKTIRVDNVALTVIGVTPEAFQNLSVDTAVDAAVPIGFQSPNMSRRMAFAMGRLKDGGTVEEARAQLLTMWPSILRAAIPAGFNVTQTKRFLSRRLYVERASKGFSFLRERMERPLTILICLAGAVLLIACANLGLLMAARAARRRNEIGIRIALGAGRWRLARQLLLECLTLSVTGAALAFVFSGSAGRLLVNMEWNGLVAPGLNVSPDARVFAFAACAAVLTGMSCGVLPAVRASRIDPGAALQQNARTAHGGGAGIRSFLVAAQIALSMVLVFGAGLFIRTLESLRNVNTGYQREGLLVMQLFPQPGREKIPNRAVYYRELVDQITRVRGIAGASFSYYGPVTGREFREAVSAANERSAGIQSVEELVAPGYFRAMGVRLIAGRDFSWQDDEHAPKVAVISESLARHLFGSGNPLGRRITMANRPELKDAEIIGVVNSASLWRVDSHKPPAAYAAMLQNADYNEPLLDIRTSGDPLLVARPASAVLTAAGRHYSVRTQTLRERLDMFLTDERMLGVLSGFFGALALILAGIGLYGLLSEAVTSRTTEIGVRMAIGAERGQVLRMFLLDAARLLAIGIGAGTAIGLGASRLIASKLFGVSPLSFSAIILPAAVLAITGWLATLIPARRASKVDPMTALRAE